MKISWHFRIIRESLVKTLSSYSIDSSVSKLSAKAAIATCLATYLSLALNFQEPFFAGFASFLMLLPGSGAVLTRAIQGIAGSIIGAIIGYFALGFTVNDHFAFSISVCLFVSIFSYLMSVRTKTSFFWYYALVNLILASMSGAIAPSTVFEIAFFRVINTCLGILCHLLVCVLILPDFTEDKMDASLKELRSKIFFFASTLAKNYLSGSFTSTDLSDRIEELELKIKDIQLELDNLKTESKFIGGSGLDHEAIFSGIQRSFRNLCEFRESLELFENKNPAFQKSFSSQIEGLASICEEEAENNSLLDKDLKKRIDSVLDGIIGTMNEKARDSAPRSNPEDILLFCDFVRLFRGISGEMTACRSENRTGTNSEKSKDLFWIFMNPISETRRLIMSIDPMLCLASIKSAISVISVFWLFFWLEIPGSATTVAISAVTVARPDIILTRHRAILRLGGCLVGAFLAFVFLAFGVQTGATMFASLFIVAYFSGIIWGGDASIAYFGYQIYIAYILAVVPDLAPAPDVTEPVQRTVGLLLGVLVTWIVYSLVFPQNLSELPMEKLGELRRCLSLCLAKIADKLKARASLQDACRPPSDAEFHELFSLIIMIRAHREIRSEDAANARRLAVNCFRIKKDLDSFLDCDQKEIDMVSNSSNEIPFRTASLSAKVLDSNGGSDTSCENEARKIAGDLKEYLSKLEISAPSTDPASDFKFQFASIVLSLEKILREIIFCQKTIGSGAHEKKI